MKYFYVLHDQKTLTHGRTTRCRRLCNSLHLIAGLALLATLPVAAEIVVGQSIPRTGSLAPQGEAIIKGTLAYINRVNASGGVNGQRIVVRTLDDGGDSKRTVENAKLLSKQGVIALFGMIEGGPCTALLPIVSQEKIPLIACMAGSPQLRDPLNRYVFPVRAAHLDEFAVLLTSAASVGNRTIGFIHSDSDTGRLHLANVTRLAKTRGMQVILPIAVSGKPDMKAIAKQIVDAKVDVMLNHGSYSAYAELIRETRALSSAPMFLAVNSGGQELARLAGQAGKGTMMSQIAPFPTSRATPIQRAYADDMKKSFPNEPFGWSSMEGYVSARVLVEGLKQTGKRLTRDGLVNALEKMGRIDLGGYEIQYGPLDRTGSKFVEVTFIKNQGEFVR
jgi:branched-chain amino acid transport system substrate-binding protein